MHNPDLELAVILMFFILPFIEFSNINTKLSSNVERSIAFIHLSRVSFFEIATWTSLSVKGLHQIGIKFKRCAVKNVNKIIYLVTSTSIGASRWSININMTSLIRHYIFPLDHLFAQRFVYTKKRKSREKI